MSLPQNKRVKKTVTIIELKNISQGSDFDYVCG